MDTGLLWLFFLIALALGWGLGSFSRQRKDEAPAKAYVPASDMKHRLQLLFDTYNDEAIDQFIQGLEVKPETLPLHISIGKHFRTQGEVDKAILVHQNLMAHPELSDLDSEPIIYELAKDYRAAGLYDRAEALLMQLKGSREFGLRSRKLLLDIYEREQDWDDAVATAQQLELRKHPELSLRCAYHWCEIALAHHHKHNLVEARLALRKAIAADRSCVRAYLMFAEIEIKSGSFQEAIKQLKQVPQVAPEFTVLALPMLQTCSEETGTLDRYHPYLDRLFRETGQVQVRLAEIASLAANHAMNEAKELLEELLRLSPDLPSLKLWLEFQPEAIQGLDQEVRDALESIIVQQFKARPAYQCGDCGFSGELMNWLCPSCRKWQSTKPRLDYIKGSELPLATAALGS